MYCVACESIRFFRLKFLVSPSGGISRLCDFMKPSFDFRNIQHAKKVVSNNPGLLDFAIARVNSALNLPNGQLTFFE